MIYDLNLSDWYKLVFPNLTCHKSKLSKKYKKKHKQTRNFKILLNLNNKSEIQAYIADSWRMISKSILDNIKVISDMILSLSTIWIQF